MSHMVIYRSVEGQPVFHQVENLEDAARHVETLRNAGQGDDARIFAMKEVKIEVKTYYRVEVAKDEAPAAPAAPAKPVVAADRSEVAPAPAPTSPPVATAEAPAPAPAPAPSAPAAVKPEPAAAGAAANGGRFGLFGKG